jgi:signal transduction histidine kinase
LGDLEALVESSRQAGISTALSMAAEADLLPPGVQLAAYRIVQESLTNAVRYAQGSSVTVRLCCQGGQLVVDVSDTGGRLGDARAGSTLGITGMRERAAAVGGTLEAGPRPEGGFRVLARLPAAP